MLSSPNATKQMKMQYLPDSSEEENQRWLPFNTVNIENYSHGIPFSVDTDTLWIISHLIGKSEHKLNFNSTSVSLMKKGILITQLHFSQNDEAIFPHPRVNQSAITIHIDDFEYHLHHYRLHSSIVIAFLCTCATMILIGGGESNCVVTI